MSDRGTYFDIKELPFVKLYKIEELKEWLVSEKILGASYDDGDYCEKFIKYDSLDSPAKMLDLVLYGKEDGMIVQDYSENRQKPRRIIHPKKVKTESDFEVIKQYTKDNDIVQFEKKWFKKSVSCRLYDGYNYDFDYVIITNTTPRTYLEEFLYKLGVKSVVTRLQERELKRTFPNLKVQTPYLREFYVAAEGCGTNNTQRIPVESDIESGTDGITLKIRDKEKFVPLSFMILEKDYSILCMRELSDEERQSGVIHEDFKRWHERMSPSGRYQLAAEFVNMESEEKFIGTFYCPELAKKADTGVEKYDKPNAYLAPCMIEKVGDPDSIRFYEEGEVAVVPYSRNGDRTISIVLRKPERIVDEYTQAKIKKIKSSKNTCTVFMKRGDRKVLK